MLHKPKTPIQFRVYKDVTVLNGYNYSVYIGSVIRSVISLHKLGALWGLNETDRGRAGERIRDREVEASY